jgi:Spy/CpxP family protein refolding chaperone
VRNCGHKRPPRASRDQPKPQSCHLRMLIGACTPHSAYSSTARLLVAKGATMRDRNLLLSVFVFCLSLMLAGTAGAQSTATSPSTPDTHAQSSPGTQPGTAPAPSTNSPGAQNSTGSQSSTSPANQTPSQGASSSQGGAGSVEDELQLTQDQKQKIATVVDDENKQISAVRDNNSMTMEQKQQKVMQIRQEGSPRIKAILSPEQLQKLAAIQQRMRDQQQGGSGQTGSQSGPQSSSPQSSSPQSSTPQSTPPQGSSPQR